MKIIKFRAYDKLPMQKLEKSFTYFTLEDLNSGKIKFPDMENWEISMFTGLLDRNSKEIYEGDIISDGTFTFPVTWDEKECRFNGIDSLEGSAKIIGNIYENQDLLK